MERSRTYDWEDPAVSVKFLRPVTADTGKVRAVGGTYMLFPMPGA
ncbi:MULTISPECIES: hypothetical protein [Streptomyces]|uniref:Uncharacterized protein n=2 Tax=Streptomyces TaxID=1883 RepID=A0ABV9IQ26_9ACTN